MTEQTQPFDDKAHIRGEIDLSKAEWTKYVPEEGEPEGGCLELAFVPHTDGETYVAMRNSAEPDGVILVFTMAEWDAFVWGVKAGEFDLPEEEDSEVSAKS